MERCKAWLEEEPQLRRGNWRKGDRALLLEIGCGKGRFTAETAASMPDTLYIALERVPDKALMKMLTYLKINGFVPL